MPQFLQNSELLLSRYIYMYKTHMLHATGISTYIYHTFMTNVYVNIPVPFGAYGNVVFVHKDLGNVWNLGFRQGNGLPMTDGCAYFWRPVRVCLGGKISQEVQLFPKDWDVGCFSLFFHCHVSFGGCTPHDLFSSLKGPESFTLSLNHDPPWTNKSTTNEERISYWRWWFSNVIP